MGTIENKAVLEIVRGGGWGRGENNSVEKFDKSDSYE